MPDLEGRVANLETRVDEQTNELRDLRGDVAAIRAENAAGFKGMRTEHASAFAELRADVKESRTEFAAAIAELRADNSAIRAAHSADTAMLLGAIRDLREEMVRRFEQMATDTNAWFQQVDGRFQQVDGRFLHIETRFQQVDEKIDRHFALLVGIQVATVSAFVSALVALYFR